MFNKQNYFRLYALFDWFCNNFLIIIIKISQKIN